jgi:hypothetical protein
VARPGLQPSEAHPSKVHRHRAWLAPAMHRRVALELEYTAGTGNLRDFERIPGLTVIRL